MRYGLLVLWTLFWSVTSAIAQVSIGIGLPGVSIGINLPVFPELVRVPDYPVYYAPRLHSNFFFYDGMYWVYQGDNWYGSSWYNGPWRAVAREVVPLFVLRIPVRYYRDPPAYFRGGRSDAPPRWGEYWGSEWEQRRSGWDKWNRKNAPAPAPLPVYQRKYSGDRYPRVEQQPELHNQNYRYQPRDAVVRQHYQEPTIPRGQPPHRGGETVQRTAPNQAPPEQKDPATQDRTQQPQQGAAQRDQHAPRSNQEHIPQGKGASQEPRGAKGQGKDRDKGEEHGQGHNK
jgi:hypothetical protein